MSSHLPPPTAGFSVCLSYVLAPLAFDRALEPLAKGSSRWAVFCVSLRFPSQGIWSYLFTEALNEFPRSWDFLDLERFGLCIYT